MRCDLRYVCVCVYSWDAKWRLFDAEIHLNCLVGKSDSEGLVKFEPYMKMLGPFKSKNCDYHIRCPPRVQQGFGYYSIQFSPVEVH